jgi:site-specific DNA-methyltransferase (adenine-specific)
LLDSILCADNCEALAAMQPESVDLVVTSPPYDDLRTYGGHSWDFYGVAWLLKRVLKPGGVIVWNVGDATKDGNESGTSMRQALHFQQIGLNLADTMVYQKQNYLPQSAPGRYDQAWEYCFVICKGIPKAANMLKDRRNAKAGQTYKTGGGRMKNGATAELVTITAQEMGLRNNVWSYPVGGYDNGHPAPMPEAMAQDCVATWSNPGDVVLDPFAGSGTTLKAAKELNRRFIGIEINLEYVEICKRRIAQDVLPLFSDNA